MLYIKLKNVSRETLGEILTRICDYEGSKYRTDFWENQNREYEDGVERVAMEKLLPPSGKYLVEVGAGFGRLTELYRGYERVIITDYARTQLEEAQKYIGADERFIYVVADVYNLPFVDSLFDTLTMVRVMHHLTAVPDALAELYRILTPDGVAVVEHASKFNLKALARWLLGRQNWNPFEQSPIEFVELNFNFHPAWMRHQFASAGFVVKNTRTVSHYRINLLKRIVPTSWLVKLDSLAQPTGNWWQLTPSLFLQAQAKKQATLIPSSPAFFRCPICHSPKLSPAPFSSEALTSGLLTCLGCQRKWSCKDGIYDFKTPLTIDN